jgi:hypothetical protein
VSTAPSNGTDTFDSMIGPAMRNTRRWVSGAEEGEDALINGAPIQANARPWSKETAATGRRW